MRIAVVAHSAVRAGGVETYLAGVVPALEARGHEVASWFEGTVDGGEPMIQPPARGKVWIGSATAADPLRPLREWRPEVIYSHGLRSVALERQLSAIAPVAFFAHSYYGACISGEKSKGFPMLTPCDRVFGPGCLVQYLPRRCGGLSPVTMARQYETQRRKRQLLEGYEVVLVASEHMARHYARHHVEARVVPLPASAGPAGADVARVGDGWRLLHLGRLERSKGTAIALEAAALAAKALAMPVRLAIGGEGSLSAPLRRHAAALMAATPRLTIEFRGWFRDDERAAALQAADLLLVPSLWPEPFGLVGIEAAAAGVPSIAFHVGGIEDWLSDGVNGRLISPAGPRTARFADAIVHTLSDPGRLPAMRCSARAAAARFTMRAHLDALEAHLATAAGARAEYQHP